MSVNPSSDAAGRFAPVDLQQIAEDFVLLRFARASSRRANAAGITARDHDVLLAVRGAPSYPCVTIEDAARVLGIAQDSASLGADACVRKGLLAHIASPGNQPPSYTLTPRGQAVLDRLVIADMEALQR